MKYFIKQAGTQQTQYKIKGNRVFKTITSTQPFEGAKQPSLDQKFFIRRDEIKDFAEKQRLLKRFHAENMVTSKKSLVKKSGFVGGKETESFIKILKKYKKQLEAMPLDKLMTLHGKDVAAAKAFSKTNPIKTLSKEQIKAYTDGVSLRAAQHQVIKNKLAAGERFSMPKTAGVITDKINNKAWYDNPLYQTKGVNKLINALNEIEERKPLAPGKNPDPTSNYILTDLGFQGIG